MIKSLNASKAILSVSLLHVLVALATVEREAAKQSCEIISTTKFIPITREGHIILVMLVISPSFQAKEESATTLRVPSL